MMTLFILARPSTTTIWLMCMLGVYNVVGKISDSRRRCPWVMAHHREQYPENFACTLDVILWQIDTKRVPFELHKLPDVPGGDGAIDGRQASACLGIEALGGHHSGTTLAQAGFEIFIFGFDDDDNRCVNEELFPRLRNEKITYPSEPLGCVHRKICPRKQTDLPTRALAHLDQHRGDHQF